MPTPPPEQLAERLAASKRTGSRDFDLAWAAALRGVSWYSLDREARADWTAALHATRHEWERAYYDEPSTLGSALTALTLEPDPDHDDSLIWGERARPAAVDRRPSTGVSVKRPARVERHPWREGSSVR